MLMETAASLLAVVAFCFILTTHRRHLLVAGLAGAAGWALYRLLEDRGLNVGTATFISGCLVALCAQLLARILKTPVTVFVIPGILPLVPGAGMYHIVDSMLRADNLTSHYVTETLVAAGMIAMSIIVMDGLFRLFFKKKGESYVDRQQLD